MLVPQMNSTFEFEDCPNGRLTENQNSFVGDNGSIANNFSMMGTDQAVNSPTKDTGQKETKNLVRRSSKNNGNLNEKKAMTERDNVGLWNQGNAQKSENFNNDTERENLSVLEQVVPEQNNTLIDQKIVNIGVPIVSGLISSTKLNELNASASNQKKFWHFLTDGNAEILFYLISYYSMLFKKYPIVKQSVGRPRMDLEGIIKRAENKMKEIKEEIAKRKENGLRYEDLSTLEEEQKEILKKAKNARSKRKGDAKKKEKKQQSQKASANSQIAEVSSKILLHLKFKSDLIKTVMIQIRVRAIYTLFIIKQIKNMYETKKAVRLYVIEKLADYHARKRFAVKKSNSVYRTGSVFHNSPNSSRFVSHRATKVPEITSNNTTPSPPIDLPQRNPNLPTSSRYLEKYEPYIVNSNTTTNLKRKTDDVIDNISIGMKAISTPYNDQQNVDTKKRKMENSNDGGTQTEMINLRNYALRLLGVFKETTPNSFLRLCLEKKEVIRCKKCPYGENKPPTYLRLLDLSLYDKDWSMQDMIEALQQERRSDSCPYCKESLFTKVNLSIPNYTKAVLVKPKPKLFATEEISNALRFNGAEMDPAYAIVEVEQKLVLIRTIKHFWEKMIERKQWVPAEPPTSALLIVYQKRRSI